MLKKFVLFFSLIFQTIGINATNFTISGYITDQSTGETLISASVFDQASLKGAVSNAFGYYSLTIPAGKVDLQYSYVGYQKENRKFHLNKDTIIHIRLIGSHELKEVVITGDSRKEFGVLGSQMGAIEVPVSQIKSIPTLFGETDVIKALQLLPGVQGGAEGSAGLYVRGGGPDENLLLLDGIPVYNVNHMFGFFSVFNADAIKNVTLYKGNFPARFGGRLSSVVDIRTNDGNDKTYHGNVSVGLISSKFNLEGPIIKEKTTFNISLRRTYADLLLKPVIAYMAKQDENVEKTKAGYYFYDLNTKISHKISDKDKLFLSFYSGDDAIYSVLRENYKNDDQNTVKSNMGMDWDWGNIISAFRWNHLINSKLFMNTTASFTRYRFDMGIEESTKEKTENSQSENSQYLYAGYSSGIQDYSVKADFDYIPGAGHNIKFGGNYIYHTF
ncbi:MAG: TonB-dependent receptor, partial [Bacteroidales bacterium]